MAVFSDDFSTRDLGIGAPIGWTLQWDSLAAEWEVLSESGAIGAQVLRGTGSDLKHRGISLDAALTSANGQLLAKVKVGNTTGWAGLLTCRGSGNAGSETGVYGGFYNGKCLIYQNTSSSYAELAQASFSYTAGAYYWLRFKAISTNLSLKAWAVGTSEPFEWTVTASDATVTSSGWFGLMHFDGGSTIVDYLASDSETTIDIPVPSVTPSALSDTKHSRLVVCLDLRF